MTRSVLVVEPLAADRHLAAALLRAAGWQVHDVADSTAALAHATEHRLDGVLLGVQRPGPEGLTLLRALRADPVLALIPVVVCSPYVMRGERAAALAAGAKGWLDKPLEPERFAAALAEMIEDGAG